MKKHDLLATVGVLLSSCGTLTTTANPPHLVREAIDTRLQRLGGVIIKKDVGALSLSRQAVIPSMLANRTGFEALSPVPMQVQGVQAQFVETPACVKYSGDTRDWDGDGVGRDYTATFSCTYQSVSGPVDLNGSYRIVDKDDNDSKSGFARNINGMNFLIVNTSKRYNINELIDFTPQSGYGQYDGSVVSTEVISGASSSMNSNLIYYPGTISDPFRQGELVMDGKAVLTEATGPSYGLSFKTADLMITNQCGEQSYIKSGSVNYTFNSTYQSNQTMVYKECNVAF
jgi:hypothetical protein